MTSQIIPLPFVLLNMEIMEKKGKNYENLNMSKTKRAFWMKDKTFFSFFYSDLFIFSSSFPLFPDLKGQMEVK